MAYCFISDLHLHEERPDITQAFLDFLEENASKAEKLYILGDLFEAWIGDDDQNNLIDKVRKALLKTNETTQIFFMHGNRDFLIGSEFASSSGMKILNDPCVEKMFGKPILLMHGDLLCTDDLDYQSFRKTTRNSKWKQEFLNKPLSERKEIATNLRDASKEATSSKDEYIMDVSQLEVEKIMTQHNVNTLIHGHTHRPNVHSFLLKENKTQRIVLGDWDQHGWYVWMNSKSCELKKFSII